MKTKISAILLVVCCLLMTMLLIDCGNITGPNDVKKYSISGKIFDAKGNPSANLNLKFRIRVETGDSNYIIETREVKTSSDGSYSLSYESNHAIEFNVVLSSNGISYSYPYFYLEDNFYLDNYHSWIFCNTAHTIPPLYLWDVGTPKIEVREDKFCYLVFNPWEISKFANLADFEYEINKINPQSPYFYIPDNQLLSWSDSTKSEGKLPKDNFGYYDYKSVFLCAIAFYHMRMGSWAANIINPIALPH